MKIYFPAMAGYEHQYRSYTGALEDALEIMKIFNKKSKQNHNIMRIC